MALGRLASHVAESRAAIAGATDADLAVEWSLIFGGRKVLAMPRAAVLNP
jgi:hypothetical protein